LANSYQPPGKQNTEK